MKAFFVLVLVLVLVGSAAAQPVDSLWSRTFGSSCDEWAWSVRQTADGGYVLLGDSNLFAPEATPCHFWLVKTDTNGDEEWSRNYGGRDFEYASSVRQTTDGGYILAGLTYSYSVGSGNAWLVKVTASGDSVWSRVYSGYASDASSVEQTTDGGYVFSGTTRLSENSSTESYLVKTDATGNAQWTRTFGGSYAEEGYSVVQTTDGGYILAGYTNSFGAGGSDFYLVKTDANGDSLWTRTFGGSYSDFAFSVQQTTDGGYIIAGDWNYWGEGGDTCRIYLVKTDASGDTEWARTFGHGVGNFAYSVQQTTDGGYIVAGWTWPVGSNGYDFYLMKTDVTGNELWTRTFGGWADDRAYSVEQTTDGGYILAGFTTSFGAGGKDFWLVKTGPELAAEPQVTLVPQQVALYPNYPNPFNPSTTLRFALPQLSQVSVDVFDISGRKVKNLYSGTLAPGEHTVTWNCPNCASGVYFARLQAGGQVMQQKMVLLK